MRRAVSGVIGVVCGLALLGSSCSSSSSSKSTGTGAAAGSTPTGGSSGEVTGGTSAPLGSGVQFGGDVCTALTKADIEGATYAQGPAVFASTEATKDSASGKTVECHYLASFNGGPSVIAANVSLMDPSEYANRVKLSIVAPPVALTAIGSEAYLVEPAPGSFEAWVKATNGYFKVIALSKDTATALATAAAARN